MDLFGSDELFNIFETNQVISRPGTKRKKKAGPPAKQNEKKSKLKKIQKTKATKSSSESDLRKDVETVNVEVESELKIAEVLSKPDSTPTAADLTVSENPEEGQRPSSSTKEDSASASASPEAGGSSENVHMLDVTVKTEHASLDDDEDDDDAEKNRSATEDLASIQKYLPQVEIRTLDIPDGSGCTHVVATPINNFYYIPLHPIEKAVKTYPFKLDLFQERAVQCVDNYQSVLVSAHTSAGKTVVAE